MHNLFRILGIFTLITSMSAGIIASAAAPTKETIRQTEQNELAVKQSNGKKQLKKKLNLDYTNPRFETELNKSQKDAILLALKKWKLDLPVNNTFTVTSISDLKKNQKVIYMWSVTPNANWDNSKPFDVEDYEEGDPRFIRTEFNVLLKKSNGGWKATLEQDNELKTELQSIPESEVTTNEKNVLFGANKSENNFTDRNEVLIETNATSSSSSSSSISSISSSSATLSSQINSSSSNSISSSSNQNISSTSSQTIGLLDILFGSPKVSAAWETDYSWPWESGKNWTVNTGRNDSKCATVANGWHGCGEFSGLDGNGSPALDMYPTGDQNIPNTYVEIKAPIKGVIGRRCSDPYNQSIVINNLRLVHLSNQEFVGEVSVNKGQKIGKLATQDSLGLGYAQTFNGVCGSSRGLHLHIKFIQNGLIIDGTQVNYYGFYNSFTSQNTPPTLPITDPNITKTQPAQDAWNKSLDQGCGITQINPVFIQDRDDNSNCQRVRYNSGNNTITNPFGKCLEAGYSTQQLIFYPCNNTNNQKWKQENSTGRIWSFQRQDSTNLVRCIEHTGLSNGNIVKVVPCNNNTGQKWYFDIGITQENVPGTAPAVFNNYTKIIASGTNSSLVLDVTNINPADGTQVKLVTNNNSIAQKWDYDNNTHQIKGLNNQCLDAGSSSDRTLRLRNCTSGNNQKWFGDQYARIHAYDDESLCLDSYQGNVSGSMLYMSGCHFGNNQKWGNTTMVYEYRGNWGVQSNNNGYINSKYNTNYVFDVVGGDNNQNPIKVYNPNGGNNQKFQYDPSTREIKNITSYKCIDAGDINNGNDRWLRIQTCHGGSNQKWSMDGNFRIVSDANTGLCVDSYQGDTAGSTLYMSSCHTGNNQKWSWILK
jgi:Ricin-type beta-trefoil lectin domain